MSTRTIILFYVINSIFTASILPNFKPFHFDRIDGMAHELNIPVRASYVIIKQDKNVLYLNSTINVKEDIEGDLLWITKLYRCDSKEALDTCELYISMKPMNYCRRLDPKFAVTNPFYIEYVPDFRCPLKKGTYRAYKAKVDFATYVVLPFGNSYWKGISECRQSKTNRLIHVIKLEGYQPK